MSVTPSWGTDARGSRHYDFDKPSKSVQNAPRFSRATTRLGCGVVLLVVEDSPTIATTIEAALKDCGGVRIESTVAGALELVSELAEYSGLIVDVGLPDGSGFDVLEACRSSHPGLPALVLTSHEDHDTIRRAQIHGAQYLPKPPPVGNLLAFAKSALSSEHGRRARLHEAAHRLADERGLSPREEQIVRLSAEGVSPGALAEAMDVSPNTIKTLTRRLLQKCGAGRLSDITDRLRK